MLMFFGLLFLLWLPMMLWWLILPHHFPFFVHKKFGRLPLFALNILAWAVGIIALTAIAPTPEGDAAFLDFVGFFGAIGVVIWLSVRGILAGKTRKAQESAPPTTDAPTIIPKPSVEPAKTAQEATEPADVPQAPIYHQPNDDGKSDNPSKPDDVNTPADGETNKYEPAEPTPPISPIINTILTEMDGIANQKSKTKSKPKQDFHLGDDNICHIHYQNSKGELSSRDILVRSLKTNKNGDWLVSAVDIPVKRVKSFRVDSIISLSHNGQIWTDYDDILGVLRTFETLL